MYIKTIEYTDYSGNKRKEDFYFDINEAELMKMELSVNGGYDQMLKKVANTQDTAEIIKIFTDLIHLAYGERSIDGRSFIKKDPNTGRPLYETFEQTAAYPVLFKELATNDEAAAEFFNKIIPANAHEAVEKAKAEGKTLEEITGIHTV